MALVTPAGLEADWTVTAGTPDDAGRFWSDSDEDGTGPDIGTLTPGGDRDIGGVQICSVRWREHKNEAPLIRCTDEGFDNLPTLYPNGAFYLWDGTTVYEFTFASADGSGDDYMKWAGGARPATIVNGATIRFLAANAGQATIVGNFVRGIELLRPGTAFTYVVNNLEVTFTDTSTNDPTSWLWEFGMGANSTDQNPTRTYTSAGVKVVTMTATNAQGSGSTITKRITVTAPPPPPPADPGLMLLTAGTNEDARFLVTAGTASEWYNSGTSVGSVTGDVDLPPTVGRIRLLSSNRFILNKSAGQNFSAYKSANSGKSLFVLTDTLIEFPLSAGSAGGGFIRWETTDAVWDVLDVISTGEKALFVFADSGSVTRAAQPPVASFTSVVSLLAVQFTDTSTRTPVSWAWNFGDGTTSTLQSPAHTYADAGTRTVTLTATNAQGSSTATAQVTAIAPNKLPLAPTVPNETGKVGTDFTATLPIGTAGDPPLAYSASDLPSWATFNISTRVLSGTPDATGVTTITYTVTDTDGDTATTTFTITIAADLKPVAPTIANQTGVVGTDFAVTLLPATGGDLPITYTVSNIPSWASFDTSSRVLSGTPDATGPTTITYTVTDVDGDTDTESFTITIAAANKLPVAPVVADQTGVVSTPFTTTLPVGTSGDAPLASSVSGLPSWATFTAATRVLSGTPDATGATTVTYTITDTDGDTATTTFTITIAAADLRPEVSLVANQTGIVGTDFSFTLPVVRGGDAPLTYSASGLPSWATFTASSRVLSGTPDATGVTTVTYVATDDDGDTATTTFTITIAAAPLPSATPTGILADFSVTVTAAITATAKGYIWWESRSVGTLKSGSDVTIDLENSTDIVLDELIWNDSTPHFDLRPFLHRKSGSFSTAATELAGHSLYLWDKTTVYEQRFDAVSVIQTDRVGWRTTPRPAGIVVGSVVRAIIAEADQATKVKKFVQVAPVASFTSVVAELTVQFMDTSTERPTSWAWNFGDGGTSTDQNPSHIYASANTYTVTLTATNTAGSNTATAQVTAIAVNLEPAAPSVTAQTGVVGTAFSTTLPPGTGGNAPLAYSISGLPSWATFATSTRILSGTPDATGVTAVTYTVTDTDGDTATAVFTITIAPPANKVPSAPTVTSKAAVFGNAFTTTLPAGTGGDTPLAYSLSGLPSWATFSTSTRAISGTPDAVASSTLTYTVTDINGDEDSETFTLAVAAKLPTAPTMLAAAVGDQQLTLSWQLNSNGGSVLTTQRVRYQPAGGSAVFRTIGVSETGLLLTGLVNDTVYDIRIIIINSVGRTDSAVILATPKAPVLTPVAPAVPDETGIVGSGFSTTLPVATGGNLPLAYSASGLPSWATFTASTRVLSGTPDATGVTTVTYTVTDTDGDTAATTFTITIAPKPRVVPTAPTVANQNGIVGVIFTIILPVGTGGNAPLTYLPTNLPSGLTFFSNFRAITGTPQTAGITTVTYTVTDNDGDTASTTFTITIVEPELTPTLAVIAHQIAEVGTAFRITLPTAISGNLPITYALTGIPTWAAFVASTRVLSGTPVTEGSPTLTYTATDNDGEKATTTFQILIAPEPPPPPPPVAGFTQRIKNFVVQFTDTSTETPTAWDWNFGDRTTHSNLQNPSHTYAGAGTYTVTLKATNAQGNNYISQTIILYDPTDKTERTFQVGTGRVGSRNLILGPAAQVDPLNITDPISGWRVYIMTGYDTYLRKSYNFHPALPYRYPSPFKYDDPNSAMDQGRYDNICDIAYDQDPPDIDPCAHGFRYDSLCFYDGGWPGAEVTQLDIGALGEMQVGGESSTGFPWDWVDISQYVANWRLSWGDLQKFELHSGLIEIKKKASHLFNYLPEGFNMNGRMLVAITFITKNKENYFTTSIGNFENARIQLNSWYNEILDEPLLKDRDYELTAIKWEEVVNIAMAPRTAEIIDSAEQANEYFPPAVNVSIGQALNELNIIKSGFVSEIPNAQIASLNYYQTGTYSDQPSINIGKEPGQTINNVIPSSRIYYNFFQYQPPARITKIPNYPYPIYFQYPQEEDRASNEEIRFNGLRPLLVPAWLGANPRDALERVHNHYTNTSPSMWEISIQYCTWSIVNSMYRNPFRFVGTAGFSPDKEGYFEATPIMMNLYSNHNRVRGHFICVENTNLTAALLDQANLGEAELA